MTQEDKELLLKDLCARLPYGVKVQDELGRINKLVIGNNDLIRLYYNDFSIYGEEKLSLPYLFPLSSMTDEQKRECYKVFEKGINESANETKQWLRTKRPDETMRPITIAYVMVHELVIEWLNKNYFDYRGLIEKELAIDATGLNIY